MWDVRTIPFVQLHSTHHTTHWLIVCLSVWLKCDCLVDLAVDNDSSTKATRHKCAPVIILRHKYGTNKRRKRIYVL